MVHLWTKQQKNAGYRGEKKTMKKLQNPQEILTRKLLSLRHPEESQEISDLFPVLIQTSSGAFWFPGVLAFIYKTKIMVFPPHGFIEINWIPDSKMYCKEVLQRTVLAYTYAFILSYKTTGINNKKSGGK